MLSRRICLDRSRLGYTSVKASSLNIPCCDAEIFTVVQRKVISQQRYGCHCCEFAAAARAGSKDPRDSGPAAAAASAFANMYFSVSNGEKHGCRFLKVVHLPLNEIFRFLSFLQTFLSAFFFWGGGLFDKAFCDGHLIHESKSSESFWIWVLFCFVYKTLKKMSRPLRWCWADGRHFCVFSFTC